MVVVGEGEVRMTRTNLRDGVYLDSFGIRDAAGDVLHENKRDNYWLGACDLHLHSNIYFDFDFDFDFDSIDNVENVEGVEIDPVVVF